MTRLGMGLLEALYYNDVTSVIIAMTIKELLEIPEISKFFDYQQLYRTLQSLTDMNFVGYGAKCGRSFTFYLTEKGINWLKTNGILPDKETGSEAEWED